jgi:hypothetical protein
MDPLLPQIRHLYEVEKLSLRQISKNLGISRKQVQRMIHPESRKKPSRPTLLQPYERLIQEWYGQYPFLKATQVYERLRGYGFPGVMDGQTAYAPLTHQKDRRVP